MSIAGTFCAMCSPVPCAAVCLEALYTPTIIYNDSFFNAMLCYNTGAKDAGEARAFEKNVITIKQFFKDTTLENKVIAKHQAMYS
jgi:hypothetical protein